jgi:hypothetical protein
MCTIFVFDVQAKHHLNHLKTVFKCCPPYQAALQQQTGASTGVCLHLHSKY